MTTAYLWLVSHATVCLGVLCACMFVFIVESWCVIFHRKHWSMVTHGTMHFVSCKRCGGRVVWPEWELRA